MRLSHSVVLLLLTLLLAACGRSGHLARIETLPVAEMYDIAHTALQRGNHDRAIRYHQRLIARFPFGTFTEQAHLELAYAQYRARRPDQAISTIDRFLRTYPTHPDADYAQYLRGLVNFEREASFVGRYVNLDPAQRDQSSTRQSFSDFSRLLRDYPESIYTADARQRMIFLRNALARHEILIARYYLRRGAFVAAVNRSKHVLENYQQAPDSGDALAIMIQSYQQLGEQELADDTRRVLELNFPEHPFLEGEPAVRPKPMWRRLVPFG